ncbi:MAG: glycosyltransferase family 2 protein [Alphaproteobacteria bacterium]|nr:glycosyltransferase family 2 protein [Alphaproteobacteria bacterium]
MVKTPPKVSILTPIYNTNPQYLKECMESILNQTFTDFEFLILNDSPDNKEIEKIVKEYARKDNRVKYYKNEKNMGISPSRNKLLDLAQGEYIAIFDHDDISLPTRLEKEVVYLDANPEIGVVSAFMQYFQCKDEGFVRTCPEYDHEIKCSFTDNCYFPHTVSMIRKSVLDENNIRYEQYFSPCEDYQLWNRLMDKTFFYCIQEVLVKYRAFDGNTTHAQKDRMDINHNAISLDIQNRYPAYHEYWLRNSGRSGTRFRLRLGFIPLLKVKNNKVYLFEFIPVFKVKWR